MDHDRVSRMRAALEVERLDALVVRLPENVLLLSGFWPMIGASTLVFPRDGKPICIAPECFLNETRANVWEAEIRTYRFGVLDSPDPVLAVGNMLSDIARGKRWTRVGYEGSFSMIAPSWHSGEGRVLNEQTRAFYEANLPGCSLVDVSALLQSERRRKTEYEAAKMRIASEISCFGLKAFELEVKAGVSGVELAALVEREVMVRGSGYKGASRVRGYAQVATGAEESAVGYRMNEISTTRSMKSGEIALLELGVVADGYWADRTRARVAGKPTDEQIRVFETVSSAQEAAIAAIRPGATCGEVDAAARAVIDGAGYGRQFLHITGHGLGFGYHESNPILAPGSTEILEVGNLTSVEPGIYFTPVGGVRLEEDVMVTASGAEVFGPYPKKLA
jgi:Xaa-Pro dipeptidase